jgi:hypothetical protein
VVTGAPTTAVVPMTCVFGVNSISHGAIGEALSSGESNPTFSCVGPTAPSALPRRKCLGVVIGRRLVKGSSIVERSGIVSVGLAIACAGRGAGGGDSINPGSREVGYNGRGAGGGLDGAAGVRPGGVL